MRKHKSDRIIGVLTILLLIVGLIVIYAIGPMRVNFMNAAYGEEMDVNYYFTHQLVSVGLSVFAFFVAFKVPYDVMRKFALVFMAIGILACLVLAVAAEVGSSVAVCQNGACRWIRIGSALSFQPAEMLKLGLVLYLAQLAARRKVEGKLMKSDFWLPFLIMCVLSVMFVVYFQQDLGTTVVLVVIIMAILLMSGIEMKVFLIACGLLLVGGVGAIFASPHRMERLFTFTEAESADTYHIDNALLAIGTGGLTGVGVGNTVQATGYLPESINDSVFAVMGETFGFLGLLLVISCFGFLLFRIMKVVERGGNDEHKLVAVGVFAWVASQVGINICAMTGLIPLTGITLPLLSYGGTSMMFTAFGLGVVLQLSCYTRRVVNEENINKISQRGIR